MLTQFAANVREPPKEKTLFLPQEKISSLQFIKEEKWWKRLFSRSAPQLIINYRDEIHDEPGGVIERKLIFEAEYTQGNIS
jgi:hypothetical protein